MKILVLDTDTLIDHVKGYAPWIEEALVLYKRKFKLVLPTIVIAEYFAGSLMEEKGQVQVAEETLGLFARQPLDEEVAKVLGGLLRHKSYPLGASIPDLIVASTAIFLDAELATRNKRHFQGIPDLRFFDPKRLQPYL